MNLEKIQINQSISMFFPTKIYTVDTRDGVQLGTDRYFPGARKENSQAGVTYLPPAPVS